MGNELSCSTGKCANVNACCQSDMKLDKRALQAVLDWQLIQAVSDGNAPSTRIALAHGADVNACKDTFFMKPQSFQDPMDHSEPIETDGITPLMRACEGGHVEIVECLLEHGANVNAVDQDGWNALFFSAKTGNVNTLETLVDHGAKTTVLDHMGQPFFAYCNDHACAAEVKKWMERKGVQVFTGIKMPGRVAAGGPTGPMSPREMKMAPNSSLGSGDVPEPEESIADPATCPSSPRDADFDG
mmetsp:Transcript_37040/g.97020  ORF Transcript_37040/g.97020 Transcript_37040/m.97020 type:complete len:243 (+) Transcript_37040:26-754(+)